MAKDKYDFISELLENTKLSITQREKVFQLFAKEIKNEKPNDKEIEARIKKIEEFLNLENLYQIDVEKYSPQSKTNFEETPLPTYINPSNLSSFLQAYNENKILKSTCHEIDEDELENICGFIGTDDYNFEKHHQKIIDSFDKLEKEHPKVDYKILGLIRVYLTGKNKKGEQIAGWSTNKIKINWNSQELIKWSNDNPGVPPNPNETLGEQFNNIGFEFDEIKNLHIKSFAELVIHFKKLFHVRSDNSLKGIILNINEKKNWNEKIEFQIEDTSFRSNIEFFTDVDKLLQAYNRVIEIILEVVKKEALSKPKIKLSFGEDKENIFFSIHHLNTVFTKSAQNLIERLGQKHTNMILKQINGLCDMYLKADFGNGEYAEVNLWDGKKRIITRFNTFNGVEHKFVFTK